MKHLKILTFIFFILVSQLAICQTNEYPFSVLDSLINTKFKKEFSNPLINYSFLLDYKGKVKTYNSKCSEKDSLNPNYHMIDLEQENQDCKSVYGIASLTKFYVAVLIAQQVEQGNISFNDSLGKFFDIGSKKFRSITIEQLLRHQSGLKNYFGYVYMSNKVYRNKFHKRKYMLKYKNYKVRRKNIGKTIYNNSGYLILGIVLERIFDKSLESIINSEIIEKYNLKNTHPYPSKSIKNLEHPIYNYFDYINYQDFRFHYMDDAFSAGTMAASVEDIYKFIHLFFKTDELISEETKKLFLNPNSDNPNFCMAIRSIIDPETGQIYGFGGNTFMYTNRFYYSVENDATLIIITNNRGFEGETHQELFNNFSKITKIF
jgi:CubicO group peptidase (beta-lactamase class C family)